MSGWWNTFLINLQNQLNSQFFDDIKSVSKVITNTDPTMDAIKKKMQAMKIEKDNAMDRADQCEQAAKAAKVN